MPNHADRAGTPAGVFGAELRHYRTQADLSQKDLATLATVSHDVISKIETGERPPAEDFPPRLDAIGELDTRGELTRLWGHLKKGHRQRSYGWFQPWADIEAEAKTLRWYEPLLVPGLLQTEDYAKAILAARPGAEQDDLDEQVAARLARQTVLERVQLWFVLDEGVLHRESAVARSWAHSLNSSSARRSTRRSPSKSFLGPSRTPGCLVGSFSLILMASPRWSTWRRQRKVRSLTARRWSLMSHSVSIHSEQKPCPGRHPAT